MAKKKQQQQQNAVSPEKYLKEHARELEIGTCYVNSNWQDNGMAYLFVTRKHKQGTYTVGAYLVDTYCLGVKDTFFRFSIDPEDLNEMVDTLPLDMVEISYNEAHNIIYGALEFAEEGGIKPHKDWAVTQYILEEDDDNIPLIEYEMGLEGKHYLIAHNNLELTTYLPTLRKHLPESEIDFTVDDGLDDEDDEDDEDYAENEDWDEDDVWDEDYSEYHCGAANDEDDDDYNENLKREWETPLELEKVDMPTLNNPDLKSILEETEDYFEDPFEELLSMPHDTLREDLEHIIRFKMTDEHDKEYAKYSTALAIMCLAEVGNEGSLRLLLDSLRIDDSFIVWVVEGDEDCVYRNTLAKLGKNHLDLLADYMREPGRSSLARDLVMHAVADMALLWPKMRGEVVEWFRSLLNFYAEALPKVEGCDSDAAGYALASIHDFGGYELYDEVERLYDTGLVNEELCGLKHKMLQHLTIASLPSPTLYPYGKTRPLNIYDRLEEYFEFFEKCERGRNKLDALLSKFKKD